MAPFRSWRGGHMPHRRCPGELVHVEWPTPAKSPARSRNLPGRCRLSRRNLMTYDADLLHCAQKFLCHPAPCLFGSPAILIIVVLSGSEPVKLYFLIIYEQKANGFISLRRGAGCAACSCIYL